MILSATWGGSFYVCLTEPPDFSHGEHQKTENVNFKALHTLSTKNKGDIMLLNNDTVDVILNLLQFVK